MTYFLSIQNTYESVEIALFGDEKLLATAQEDKMRASKYFIRILEFILKDNNIELSDLAFLAANQGPGPFTTLRVVIASVNGLGFATQIPLIGIDGLDALLLEYPDAQTPISVAILNAFNNDVYYGISEKGKTTQKGCKNIDLFLDEIKTRYPKTAIRLIGNGAQIYASNIEKHFAHNAIIPSPLPLHCSVKQIGVMGWDRWNKKEELAVKLMPLYLKQTIVPAGVESTTAKPLQ